MCTCAACSGASGGMARVRPLRFDCQRSCPCRCRRCWYCRCGLDASRHCWRPRVSHCAVAAPAAHQLQFDICLHPFHAVNHTFAACNHSRLQLPHLQARFGTSCGRLSPTCKPPPSVLDLSTAAWWCGSAAVTAAARATPFARLPMARRPRCLRMGLRRCRPQQLERRWVAARQLLHREQTSRSWRCCSAFIGACCRHARCARRGSATLCLTRLLVAKLYEI